MGPFFNIEEDSTRKKSWKCLAIGCGKEYAEWNAIKAMVHGARATKHCWELHYVKSTGKVSQEEIGLFKNIWKIYCETKDARKRVNLAISNNITAF